MKQFAMYLALAGGFVLSFFAQQPAKLFHMESASTVALNAKGSEQTLAINNVAYEVTGDSIPGRPTGQRLLLRKTVSSSQVLGDIGLDSTATIEAWPLGTDLKQKPIYSVKATGTGGETVDSTLIVMSRGLEEVEWWSVYRLGTGQHLFDSYTPVASFSISQQVMEMRYIGLEVPPDNAADARLKRPDVIAVVTYASEKQVKREALLTCDNADRAAILRSYADTTHKVTVPDEVPVRSIRIGFRENYPSAPAPVSVTIPIGNDDLDIAHAQLPAHLHLAAWKR